MLNLSPDELLTTTRTVRKRLDFDRPVDKALIEECIEIAIQAPSGHVKQNWHWVVVGDPEMKKRIAEVYADSWYSHLVDGKMPPYDESDLKGQFYASQLCCVHCGGGRGAHVPNPLR